MNFFTPSYVFNQNPGPFIHNYGKYLMIFFAVFVVAGAVAYAASIKKQYSPLVRKSIAKISNFLLTIGIVTILLVFCREESVLFFSMPFLLYLWFILALVWLFFLYKYFFKTIPQRKKEIAERKEKEKYLP